MTVMLREHWELVRVASAAKEAKRRERDVIQTNRDRKEREERLEADDAATVDALVGSMLAAPEDIAHFTVELDSYDALTTEALLENEELLAAVRRDLRLILDKAYVLPDGRRVFKTEDGTRIFDEHGVEVTDLDTAAIEDERPRWEVYSASRDQEAALVEQRSDLIEYQERLDGARDRLGDEALTKDELEELRKDLEDGMPDVVRRKLDAREVEFKVDSELGRESESQHVNPRFAARLDMPTL